MNPRYLAHAQKSESCFIKWLGKHICKLNLGRNIAQLNVTTVDMIMDKIVTDLDMLGPLVQHRVVSNLDSTFIIT